MAFAGLKKQFNKANQFMSEKIGGAEGTKLDEDFTEMERRTDVVAELVEELQTKTKEYLQPNPGIRAKMAAVKGISKLSGQAKAATYPQPEGMLGECMVGYGKKLDMDGAFANALNEFGESLKQMADVKYSLDDNIKQNFLEPLHHLQTKDIKEVQHHRKKLQGRRLDYDCKKRKQVKGSMVTDDELKMALDKFGESLHHAQVGMAALLDSDVEQISQLSAFAEGLLEYHRQCVDVLQSLTDKLEECKEEAKRQPRREIPIKPFNDLHLSIPDNNSEAGKSPLSSPTRSAVATPQTSQPQNLFPSSTDSFGSPMNSASPARSPMHQGPCCTALYDFDPENPGELGFKEGDTIQLVNQIDENWYEGSVRGQKGLFPVTYVQVVTPLP